MLRSGRAFGIPRAPRAPPAPPRASPAPQIHTVDLTGDSDEDMEEDGRELAFEEDSNTAREGGQDGEDDGEHEFHVAGVKLRAAGMQLHSGELHTMCLRELIRLAGAPRAHGRCVVAYFAVGSQVHFVTVGVDGRGRVRYQQPLGRGVWAPLYRQSGPSFTDLTSGGARFLGRFRGASEEEIDTFARALAGEDRVRTTATPFARLPLRDRSPCRAEGERRAEEERIERVRAERRQRERVWAERDRIQWLREHQWAMPFRRVCVACTDSARKVDVVEARCRHSYCFACLERAIETACESRRAFQCCGRPIPNTVLQLALPA